MPAPTTGTDVLTSCSEGCEHKMDLFLAGLNSGDKACCEVSTLKGAKNCTFVQFFIYFLNCNKGSYRAASFSNIYCRFIALCMFYLSLKASSS